MSQAVRFVATARAWCRNQAEGDAIALLRSPHSGVPHDIAAAYATVARHFGGLRESIARERLAITGSDRDAIFTFARKLDDLQKLAGADDATIDSAIREMFQCHAEPAARSAVLSERSESKGRPSEHSETRPIALCDGLEREKPVGVPARTRHFSASSLNAYEECARKWFYRYTCAAVDDPGSPASFYGTAFHLALEDFHAIYVHPEPADEQAMRAQVRIDIARAFEEYRADFGSRVAYVLQTRRAQRTAQQYVTWLVARARRRPFTVVGREAAANLDLEGFDFVGFIDRLDRDDRTGGVSVIDYKTGSIAESAAEYREKVRTFADFQLPFYYWAREAHGDRVATLALVPLKDALVHVRAIELEVVPGESNPAKRGDHRGTIGILELERARSRMIEICRELASGALASYPVATDPEACTYCAYKLACNDRPAPAEERFGR